METEPALYFNPSCSKCRTADALLKEHGIEVALVRYREVATTDELRRLMSLLVIDDPRAMMRTSEPVYDELGLGDASSDQLLAAINQHPILLERPIFVVGDRAGHRQDHQNGYSNCCNSVPSSRQSPTCRNPISVHPLAWHLGPVGVGRCDGGRAFPWTDHQGALTGHRQSRLAPIPDRHIGDS